jgi:ubiquinone/menaquinone biosynthesis C-methylase UbiE
MHASHRPFLPAAGFDLLLPLYDPLTRLLGADALRRQLIERADVRPGQRVLDIGCGTGTLAIAAKTLCPGTEVSAIDPDARALERARRKAAKAGVTVRFDLGYGDALPYAAGSFSRVFSSFMLHHLDAAAQRGLIAEAFRVLEPSGTFHLVDFVHPAHGGHGRKRPQPSAARPMRRGEQDVLDVLASVGFSDVRIDDERSVLFQRVLSYRAQRGGT